MKTISLKKVSAVAVASLGFGLLSVVPANAAISALTDISVAEVAAAATNLNQIVEVGSNTTAAERSYNIYTGGTATIATADIETVTTGTGVSADEQRVWIAPGALTTVSAAVAAFGRFPATTVGGTVNGAVFPAVTGSLTLTGTPAGLTTTTIAGSEAGTVYTIFAQVSGGTLGTPAAGNAYAQITVYTRVVEATLGDGGAPTTKGAVNGVAGPANTVSLRAIDSDSTAGAFNLKRLITVSGAGGKITTVTAAPVAVATDGLTATITPNNATPSFNTLTILTPTVGTITVSSFTETAQGSGIFGATAASTVTVTVNAAALAGGVSATTSTGVMNAAATWSSTTEATVTASRTQAVASSVVTPVASIKVSLGRVSGAITTSTAVTASIAGNGTLYLNDDNNHTTSPISSGRSISSTVATTTETFYVMVAPDGTSGVGTVTITAGAYSVTKTVNFYGSASKYTATTILNATANGAATSDTVVVCAVDSANVAVPGSIIYAYSGDTTVLTTVASATTVSSAVPEDLNGATGDTDPKSIDPTLYVAAKAIGCAGFAVTGLSQTTKSSAVMTFGNAATQAASTVTTTATVGVGSVAATTVTLSANKATYAPGEKMTITLTFKDSASRLVAAGAGTGTLDAALSSSVALSGAVLFNATSNTSKLGVVTADVFAPLTAGPVTLTGETGANATFLVTAARGIALSVVATVTDGNAAASAALNTRIDSLNAKIVALTALIAKIMKSLKIK